MPCEETTCGQRGTHLALFADRCCRRVWAWFAVTAAEFTTKGYVNILINRHTSHFWGCLQHNSRDNGLQICSKPSLRAVYYNGFGIVIQNIAAHSYHLNGNEWLYGTRQPDTDANTVL